MAGDRVEAALHGQPPLEFGILRRRVGEEVDRSVLESLVDGQREHGAVPEAVPVEDPVEAGTLAQVDVEIVERGSGRRHGIVLEGAVVTGGFTILGR